MEQPLPIKQRREWPIVVAIVIAIVLTPCAIYVGAFFLAGESGAGRYAQGVWIPVNEPVVHRVYPVAWMVPLFEPAGELEEQLMGYDVVIQSRAHKSP